MEDNKAWWQSKAVWGGIVALGSVMAGAFGYTINEGTQDEILQGVLTVIGILGSFMAIYGRMKAEKKIGK